MDAMVIIGTLAGVIATLGGAVALLYRAQVATLNDRIADMRAQMERWQKVAEQNGAAAQESVILARQMKDLLDRIQDEVREAREARSGSGGRGSGR